MKNNLSYITITAVSMTVKEIQDLVGEQGLRLVSIPENGGDWIFCECKEKRFPWRRVTLVMDSGRNVIMAPKRADLRSC